MILVPAKKLHRDSQLPTYANFGDAGADLYSYESVTLLPRGYALISTGIALAIPQGYVGLVHPRSGLASRLGVTVLNAPGTVDSSYRGAIKVNLINLGPNTVKIKKGDRIAQIVFQEFKQADFELTDNLGSTSRGEGGHGSTGGFSGEAS